MEKWKVIAEEFYKNPNRSVREIYEAVKDKIKVSDRYVRMVIQKLRSESSKFEEQPKFISVKRKDKVLFMSDIHIPFHNKVALELAIEYALKEGITKVVLGGDIVDFKSISYWKNRERMDFKTELEEVRKFLYELRELFPIQEIYFIAGNHELRLERYLLTHAEKLFGIEELALENLLKLKDLKIKYIDTRDYIQQYGTPFSIGKLYYIHGHEVRTSGNVVNVARTVYLKTQQNIIFGHWHTTQEYIHRDVKGDVYGAWAVGCLCDLAPDYSIINNWNNGFAIIEYEENGEFHVYNKKIIRGKIY